MIKRASWISYYHENTDRICPVYKKEIHIKKHIKRATMYITARGVYEAKINGQRISNYVLAPGWTVYEKRHQYQVYNITELLKADNELTVTVANGWYRFEDGGWFAKYFSEREAGAIIVAVDIEYEGEEHEYIFSDESWLVGKSNLLYSDIYNGEIFDATKKITYNSVTIKDYPKEVLIPQEGEIICEHERIKPLSYIITPKGEKVIDFGQNMTGYVEFTVTAKAGEKVKISHAEILDKDGNFYTENYRKAKANIEYICKDGTQTHKPSHNFYGFRYIRLDEYPEEIQPENFTAIVVHSDIKRTGYLTSGSTILNQFFSNIFWGQKGNFLDVPTDCPQRDERLGWTADAQVFLKTASYNYDVKRFFKKWLNDVSAEQQKDGMVPDIIPNVFNEHKASAAWGDAVVICPWQLYLTYADKEMLKSQFPSMKLWVSYICSIAKDEYLWRDGTRYGDWLAVGCVSGNLGGETRKDFISSAFFANAVALVIKAGKVLDEDVLFYEELYKKIISAFRKEFSEYYTQTEYVLAIMFDLTPDIQKTAEGLAEMVQKEGISLTTGFVGTPYLLHALTKGGYTKLAYSLLLREKYPSWLFSVKMGATTVWEHWDGIREDGSLWSSHMNSYNHYAYGAVLDWVYEVAAGIKPNCEFPGFEKIKIEPYPDKRLGHLEAKIETKYGLVSSYWVYKEDGTIRYEITTPSEAEIVIAGKKATYPKGRYLFYSNEIEL